MERIDLLWDAWEDCLCKEQLRAEFDRLTAENEKLSTKVATLQSHLDNISEPIKKAAATSYTLNRWARECENERCHHIPDILKAIASYLDSQKASERPYCNHWSIKDYSEKHDGKADGCPICNPKPIPHTTQGWKDRIWPVKPARCEHSDSSGVFWEGLTKDCPICNPAPHIYVDSHGEEWSHSGLEKDCPICRLKPLSGKLP